MVLPEMMFFAGKDSAAWNLTGSALFLGKLGNAFTLSLLWK
jgi:hypothetical protein